DREQLKKHIQLTMNSEKCTFDKAIRKICYHELWKTACKRLDKIIKKLKIYHQAVRKFRESTLSCWPNTVGNLMRDIFGYSVVFQMNNFKNNAG
ncbi:MAG: hypothetical protein KAH03_07600, partial [Cocleimonas sp.]|nr:hypothetical protein [Cocleimonas sp.]